MVHVLTIMTLNICTMSSLPRMHMLARFIQQQAVDICFLQEVTTSVFPGLDSFHVYTNIGDSGRGTAFVTRAGLELTNLKAHPSGRLLFW